MLEDGHFSKTAAIGDVRRCMTRIQAIILGGDPLTQPVLRHEVGSLHFGGGSGIANAT